MDEMCGVWRGPCSKRDSLTGSGARNLLGLIYMLMIRSIGQSQQNARSVASCNALVAQKADVETGSACLGPKNIRLSIEIATLCVHILLAPPTPCQQANHCTHNSTKLLKGCSQNSQCSQHKLPCGRVSQLLQASHSLSHRRRRRRLYRILFLMAALQDLVPDVLQLLQHFSRRPIQFLGDAPLLLCWQLQCRLKFELAIQVRI